MKTMIRVGLMAAVVGAILLSASGLYAGQDWNTPEGEAKKEAHFKKMTEELGLNPEQKTALDKDREEFAAKSKDLKNKMHAAKSNLKEELDKPTPDKGRVDSLIAELKNLAGQQIQYRVDKVMATKQILTPEQFSKMKSSMDKGKHDKRPHHGNKGDDGHGDKGDHDSHDVI